jgi:hypothetical protein
MSCYFFLKIEDDGSVVLAHLLLRGFEDDCFLASAKGTGSRLVEATPSSRTTRVTSKKIAVLFEMALK